MSENDKYIKDNIVEYLNSRGIPSRDTTHEKIGQTSIVFTSQTPTNGNEAETAIVAETAKAEDSLGASLRHLKYLRW
jgi:hypothetical protein